MFNVRVFPVPVNVPLVAEPPPSTGAIVMSVASNPVGKALNVRVIEFVVGLPTGVAVQLIGPANVTCCGPGAIPARSMETYTVPANALEIFNVRVFPVPVKVPLVGAGAVPEAIVISAATSPAGKALKLRLMDDVGEPGFTVIGQLIGATSVTRCGPGAIPARLMEISTSPAVTLVSVNVRVFPVPVKAPLVAEPVTEVMIMSVATSPVGAALKVKLTDGVGEPGFTATVQVTVWVVTLTGPGAIPARLMEISTSPVVTLETFKVRVFPVPVKVPLVIEPPPIGVIVMSVVTSPVGAELKVRVIECVVGLPTGVAVQPVGPARITLTGPRAIPALMIEISTSPAITSVSVNVRVFPEPLKAPLVAEPPPSTGVIVMSAATSPVGKALKVRVIEFVVGLPMGTAVQVIGATSVTL